MRIVKLSAICGEIECNPARRGRTAYVCTTTLICFSSLWSTATSVSKCFISLDYVICTLDAADRVKECSSEAGILWNERKRIYNAPSAVSKRVLTHWGFIMHSEIGHSPLVTTMPHQI